MSKIEVKNCKPHIGATIHVDRAHLFDADVAAQCLAALEDRGVIVFPQLNLNDEEQLRFTDTLGDRVNFVKNAPGGTSADEQDVYKITLDPKVNQHQEYVLGTFFWHVDGATMDMPLPKATLLSGRVLSDKGGETEFCNLYAAYEAMPDTLKAEYADLRVLHTIGSSMREVVEEVNEESVVLLNVASKMTHPLVWTHQSGRKSLLLGSHADRIIDWPLAQGRALIRRLTEWAAQPDFVYSHKWGEGDFVIWDNCGVMHRVNPYEDTRRTMHRTTLAGVERVA
jgi:alpha-ketoglutarate-dependent taurine dioxygenase